MQQLAAQRLQRRRRSAVARPQRATLAGVGDAAVSVVEDDERRVHGKVARLAPGFPLLALAEAWPMRSRLPLKMGCGIGAGVDCLPMLGSFRLCGSAAAVSRGIAQSQCSLLNGIWERHGTGLDVGRRRCLYRSGGVVAPVVLEALDLGSPLPQSWTPNSLIDREAARVVVFRLSGLRLVGILAQRRLGDDPAIGGALHTRCRRGYRSTAWCPWCLSSGV